MRKSSPPPFSGEEAMYSVISSQLFDKRDHSSQLKKLMNGGLENRKAGNKSIRIMLLGSENDEVEFVSMVEKSGGVVVIDDHCTGSRYFWDNSEISSLDPITRIARRLLKRPRCPSKELAERTRLKHILDLYKEWGAEGAIILQQKFCDPHEFDNPPIKKYLEKEEIPTLSLELDVTVPIGQFKIRTEAFYEIIRGDIF